MALIDRKVNDWSQAVSSLDDKPKMTAAALKAAFDSNSNQLKPAINGIIDDLTGSQGALNIGLTPIDGLSGSNVQSVLQAISLLIKSNDVDLESLERLFTADGASLVGLQPVSGVSASNLQQAIISLADTISKIDPYLGNPVAISQGGTDANDSQNALYNLGCGVRKNYFDNPDFKINQEKAEYNIPISMGKIVDRWYSEGIGDCEYTENGIITDGQYLRQMWQSGTITAGKWTFSALCTGNLHIEFGKYGYSDISVKTSSDNYDNGFASVTFEVSKELADKINYNDYIYIWCYQGLGERKGLLNYVKLEKGETQTLARKLEDGSWELLEKPDYVAELAKCQIYFKRLPAYYLLGGAVQNNAVFQYSLNPPMRIAPTITIERETDLTNAIDDGTHIITPTKLTKMRVDKESICFYYTFEQGENKTSTFYNLRYVDVSAEL